MGETAKKTGDYGEAGCEEFFELLGWDPKVERNYDFDCGINAHKTKNNGDKRSHGIDFIYAYLSPYTNKTVAVLVDSKAVKWQFAGKPGKRRPSKNSTSISNDLTEFVEIIHEKVSCASLSAELKEQVGANFSALGLIFYFVHEGEYSTETFAEALEGISIPKDAYNSEIHLFANEKINSIYSMLKHIELQKKELGAGAESSVCQFRLERHELHTPTTDHFTIENLLSSFVLVKVSLAGGETRNNIYYFGSYEKPAIQMFLSALFRYQLHLVDNLVFYPVSLKNPINKANAINEYFRGKKLVCGDVEINITLGDIDSIEYKLKVRL